MKLVAVSDLHGYLPGTPTCDVLVIAGDVLPLSAERGEDALRWLDRTFRPWLEAQPADHIVAIAGNHDCAFEMRPWAITDLKLPWTYLLDSGTEIDGVSFWGHPWTPSLPGWAFYGDESRQGLSGRLVPEGTMVTITHSPPRHHGGNDSHPEWCSAHVNDMIKRVKPKVHFSGHIHEGYGAYPGYHGHTDIYNVSHCDITYHAVNRPRVVHL